MLLGIKTVRTLSSERWEHKPDGGLTKQYAARGPGLANRQCITLRDTGRCTMPGLENNVPQWSFKIPSCPHFPLVLVIDGEYFLTQEIPPFFFSRGGCENAFIQLY